MNYQHCVIKFFYSSQLEKKPCVQLPLFFSTGNCYTAISGVNCWHILFPSPEYLIDMCNDWKPFQLCGLLIIMGTLLSMRIILEAVGS